SNGAPFSVGNSGTPAIWDVRSGIINHSIFGDFFIGENTSFNQLILTNGAFLTNANGAILGRFTGANSNSVTLTGAGSQWRLDDGIYVGNFGSGNRLVVSNGATIVTGSASVVGNESPSTNNEVLVTGVGSSWTSGLGQMFVGGGGKGNRLLVNDGGLVASFS